MKRRQQCQSDSMSVFREDSPRPPVPGEEDKPVLASTRTQSSGKNLGKESQDSATTTISASYCLGNSSLLVGVNARKCHSQGTSEKPMIAGSFLQASIEFEDGSARLGFEPEGSSIKSPPFLEGYGSATVTHAQLQEGLSLLLEDAEGIKLFRQFVDEELGSNAMEFWLACRGLKKMVAELQPPLANSDKVKDLVKVIFKKFVKSSKLELKLDLKQSISEKLKKDNLISETIFDDALVDVEHMLTTIFYPQFIRCEAYLHYIQNKADSPHTQSSNSSECSSIRPMSTLLPMVREEEEQKAEDMPFVTQTCLAPAFTDNGGMQGLASTENVSRNRPSNTCVPPSVPVGSVQDSELQSLSSEALTDDTISLTDSSMDGRGEYLPCTSNKSLWKKHQTAIRRKAETNEASDLDQHNLSRLQYSSKERNIAEKDPDKFAALLTQRLLSVRFTSDLMNANQFPGYFQKVEKPDDVREKSGFSYSCQLPFNPALFAAMAKEDHEESAQNILESHMLRVFDGSSGQTPNHIMSPPGRYSPDHMLLSGGGGCHLSGRQSEQKLTSRSEQNPYPDKPVCHRHPDRKIMGYAAGGNMTGNTEWSGEGSTHRRLHQLPLKTQKIHLSFETHGATAAAVAMTKSSYGSGVHQDSKGSMGTGGCMAPASDPRRLPASTFKANDFAKGLEVTTGIHQPNESCCLDSASEKVMMWILENEKLSAGKTQCSTDCSDRASSHKRSSHIGGTGGNGRLKPLLHDSQGTVLPSQPIIQDPSMPLLTPPDPTTQLEEARRRLEQEARARLLLSRSFAGEEGGGGVNCGDCRTGSSSSAFQRSFIKSHPLQTELLSSSLDHSSISQAPTDKMGKRSSAIMLNTSSQPLSDATVVVYFFCDEEIPYSTRIHGKQITLAQFKQHLAKKGQFRYFFKRVGCETTYEEICDDDAVIPLSDGKISAKISRTA